VTGNKWSEIAKHLPGRSENSIKNFFYSRIRKLIRQYNKKNPDSEKITQSVKQILKDRPLFDRLVQDVDLLKKAPKKPK
jgi:hypothetical protein